MTHRERIEARLEKRQAWAESRTAKATAAFDGVRRIADGIPFGQPILVGHHSERHARRDQDRIHRGMARAVESQDMAAHHTSKAAGLERQLERSIFSDDPDAIEALEARAAELDAEADQENAINKAWRKAKGAPGWADGLGLTPEALANHNRTMALCPYLKGPCFSTNTRANARRLRKRIEDVKRQQARQQAASDNGGMLVTRHPEHNWCSVTFDERPDNATLDALKAAGFGWGGGSWGGYLDRLPACISDAERGGASA